MSSDPDAPADPSRLSGGHVIRNMIYSHDASGDLEIVTGWQEQGVREYNQEIVRPARQDLSRRHPCYTLNAELLKCSLSCPPEMKLGGRTATCNTERQALMKCFVKNKAWTESQATSSRGWLRWIGL